MCMLSALWQLLQHTSSEMQSRLVCTEVDDTIMHRAEAMHPHSLANKVHHRTDAI